MLLKIISILFFAIFAYADIIKVYATKALEENKTIILQKPLIIYKDFIIQAQKGIVKNDKTAVLEGNVTVFYQNSAIEADKVTVISKNKIFAKNNIIYDRNLDLWFKTKNVSINGDLIKFKKVIFSSCCIDKPDWFIYSKKGSYNKKTKYIKLYNLTLYVHKVPVFYFPFYFNSLDKTRRSGLLRPYFGYSAKEGFLYTQPVYIVLGQRADLEFDPTIRTARGRGLYATFRFVDSPNSYGEIKLGEFIDYDKYFTKYNLANKKHFGYQFLYERNSTVFTNDKLYMDLKYANDVDYFYLNPYNYTFNTSYLIDKTITSKINYINRFNTNYIFGIYAKYFIDTSKLSNEDTIQVLPQINLHKFVTKNSNILNSFDANFYNYYSIPTKYYQFDTLLPISYSKAILNHYLSYKITESFSFASANYYNSQTKPDVFSQLYTSVELYSSLIKKDGYLHIINPSVTFNFNNYNHIQNSNNLLGELKINNSVNLKLFQIFENGNFYLDHSLSQMLYIDSNQKNDLENTLNVKKGNYSLNLQNKYSWDYKRTIYNALTASYSDSNYLLKMTHIYKYDKINTNKIKTITLRFEKSLNQYKRFYTEYSYDLLNRYNKYILLGVKMSKKCWQYDIGFKRNRIPVLKEDGISYRNDYILNFNVYFNPIGGLKQSILLN
ncbi:LPS-assembly protein LptD [Caminibacter pacificus]|uniref:LPS-assembly protein LptD n=1 Tax=Caminibacter pacificus TaxID=1424653 RepID=A0ABX5TK86_9BACT|nr:LPS-assembly protein LptD [Caminibacter pacificus]